MRVVFAKTEGVGSFLKAPSSMGIEIKVIAPSVLHQAGFYIPFSDGDDRQL